jgi:hypothetical protein
VRCSEMEFGRVLPPKRQSSAAMWYGRRQVCCVVARSPCGHTKIGRQCEACGYQHCEKAVHPRKPLSLSRGTIVTESTAVVDYLNRLNNSSVMLL